MSCIFSVSELADALEAGLRAAFSQLDAEQAVYGLDVADELTLHSVIGLVLHEAGFGVYREQRYSAERHKRSFSEGERCDFVLTPDHRELAQPESAGTLFDPIMAGQAVGLDEALWMEVKVVSQFTSEGPNRNYSSELLSTVRRDIVKLSKDSGILHAALLLILFVRDEDVAKHDLNIWQDRCLSRGLPIGAPSVRPISILDRHGHGLCMIAVYPVSHL